MKKNLIIWGAALILIAAAVVTVNNYNRTVKTASAAKASSTAQETDSPAASTAASTSMPAPTSPSTPALTSTQTSTTTPTSRVTPTSVPARTSTTAPTSTIALTSTSAPTFTPVPTAVPEDSGGNKAPGFTLTDLNGTKVSLSDFKGKKVFLNFWATWCPPCRGEMPDIEKIYRENNKDLVILAVNIGEDRNTVKSFIDKNKYSFRVLLDTDQEIADLYNINAIPASFFIDRNGNLAARQIGAMDETEMKEYINRIK